MNAKWKSKMQSKDFREREAFVEYLGKKKSIKRASEFLASFLDDEESIVRSAAINSLAKLGSTKYFNKVLRLLEDNDEIVRIEAVTYIACLGKSK
jgi:HEAT repeat protein